ncbi:MAG TPA: ATP-binding protein [Vicinamibacteria bacterium]
MPGPERRRTIGFRLAASFAAMVVLMMLGSAVAVWQFQIVRRQAQRLYLVDSKAVSVLRVHTDVLTFRANLEGLVETRDLERFAAEAAIHRAVFAADVDRALEALRATPGPEQQTMLRTLETIRLNLPVHADDVTDLARLGEWQAVRRRLENQVKSLGQSTGAMVEQIEREVAREQAATLEGIERVQRQAAWTLSLTGLLTLLLAGWLGLVATRRITRPLGRLRVGAQALARGEFDHQVEVGGDDELKDMADVFNRAAGQLRELYRALTRSEEHFRSLIENASDLIVVLSPEGQVRYVSPSSRRVVGRDLRELVGGDVFSFVEPGEGAEELRSALARPSAAAGRTLALVFRHADGSRRVLEAVLSTLPSSADVVVNCRDVTDRTQAEQREAELRTALLTAAREWEQTFDAIETPMLMVREAGRIARLNRAARELAQRPYDELVGRALTEMEAAEPWREAARLAARVAEGRAPVHAQVRDEARGRTWDLTADPVTGPAADGERVVVAARDVTRMVELQESLRRSETFSAMGTLVAGVAHEVRNPLFGISANLDAFEARFGSRPEYAETIGLLRSELDRLVLLMNDLLDFGRPVYESPAPEAVEAVVAQAIRACASQARRAEVAVVNEVAAELGACVMDRRRIAQVLQNLLENAIQHSARGGAVAVSAEEEAGRDGRAWIACRVRDSGPGFAPADLPHIFEPFFTRRPGGTGLGLSIVQRIVHLHGGTITAANVAPVGAAVTFRLPRHGPA